MVKPLVKRQKILGVKMDNIMHFSVHVKTVREKVRTHNIVLKSFAGSWTDKDKETLTATYKVIWAIDNKLYSQF